jgi:alkylation response protein AidB-like acyl-CoA dehydrogenase
MSGATTGSSQRRSALSEERRPLVDYGDSPDEAAFRTDLRAWLAEHVPPPPPPLWETEATHHYKVSWMRALYDGGWVGLSWPAEFGGRGLSPLYEAILNEELGAAGVPNAASSVSFLGRAILEYGTERQCHAFLPKLLRGESTWCEGFSEPAAGSDLASLSTFAERRGDVYVVNGQKLWTGGAQYADRCLLLARTDRNVPKHQGITTFILRMDAPGITVRPILQVWGGTRFCEVFLEDVEVPVEDRLGREGQGWNLATVVLAYERGPTELGVVATHRAELARLAGKLSDHDTAADEAFGRAWAAVEACRLQLLEGLTRRAMGEPPGPASSVGKLLMIRAEQMLGSLEFDCADETAVTGEDQLPSTRYLWSRAASVYGGAEQIQRNIVAQRVLGLPRR